MLNYESFIKENNITIKDNKVWYTNWDTGEKINEIFLLSLENVHKAFCSFNYEKIYNKYKKTRNPEIENYQMIPFSYLYYYFIVSKQRIPEPEEFINTYIQHFCTKVSKDTYTFKEKYLINSYNILFKKEDIAGRMLRGYNSYNREIELFLQLREKFKSTTIEYNLKEDLFGGVDIFITSQGKTYGLATYVNTKKSNKYKSIKNNIRHNYTNICMVDLKATFSGPEKNTYSCNQIYIYSYRAIEEIRKKIA